MCSAEGQFVLSDALYQPEDRSTIAGWFKSFGEPDNKELSDSLRSALFTGICCKLTNAVQACTETVNVISSMVGQRGVHMICELLSK